MNVHEHQAKELLRRYAVAVPEGTACFSAGDAVAAAEALGFPCVVKAQIHAGGRGKAGGVKVVKNASEARAAAEGLLGRKAGADVFFGLVFQVGAEFVVEIAFGGRPSEESAETISKVDQHGVLIRF